MYWFVELMSGEGLVMASVIVMAGNEAGAVSTAIRLFEGHDFDGGMIGVTSLDDIINVVSVVRGVGGGFTQ